MKEIDMKMIKDVRIKIDEEEVLRYQGYHRNKAEKTSEIILPITREEIEQGYHLFEPQGAYSKVMIKNISSEGRINLENGFSLDFSNLIINLLKGSSYLVLGVVTIGSSLENKVSEFFSQGEYCRALALDAVGTVAVENLSRYVRNLVCQEAKDRNFLTTRRFSPGYSKWDISQQKNIFQIIPVDKIGVKLTDSCMMIPKKSLSWVVGVGKNITTPSKEEGHSCKTCQAENCQFRKCFN
jgi:hypothetical protein